MIELLSNEMIFYIIKYLEKNNITNILFINKTIYNNLIDILDILIDNNYKITYKILFTSSIHTIQCNKNKKIYKINNLSNENIDFKIFQYIYSIYHNTFIKYQMISYFHEIYLSRLKSIYGKEIRLPQYYDIDFMNMIDNIPIHILNINLYNIYSIGLSYILLNNYNFRKQFSKAVLDDIEYYMLLNMTNVYKYDDINHNETIISIKKIQTYLKYSKVNEYITILLSNYLESFEKFINY